MMDLWFRLPAFRLVRRWRVRVNSADDARRGPLFSWKAARRGGVSLYRLNFCGVRLAFKASRYTQGDVYQIWLGTLMITAMVDA